MINRVYFNVERTFSPNNWKVANTEIESIDRAVEIAEELEEMNPTLDYRIVRVTEEFVTYA